MSGIDQSLEDLLKEQMALNQKIKAKWAERTPDQVSDYQFTRDTGEQASLADLFGEHDRLLVVHNMGFSCPYCTLWADGFSATEYFYQQEGIAFVISSPDSPEAQSAGKAKRGWKMPMVSTAGTSFAKDMNMESEMGVMPGISAFTKEEDGSIVRRAFNYFGPGDQYCAVFHFMDFFPAKAS